MQGFKRRTEHKARLLDAVAEHLVDHPFERMSLMNVAEACGVSMWALRYNFKNIEWLFRVTAGHLIKSVVQQSQYQSPATSSVLDAIHRYAIFLAALVRTREYRNLLYLVIRNGRHHRWLEEEYEQRIVSKLCRDLEAVVDQAGRQQGSSVAIRKDAPRRLHKRIETELALCTLLPHLRESGPAELDRLTREIAREAFEATYATDSGYVLELGRASAA
jgi:AcrR family transcriptional regulator